MTGSQVFQSDRYVVASRHPGGILPGSQRELDRPVSLEPGAVIEGAVVGGDFTITGPDVTIAQSCYSTGEINVTTPTGRVAFCSSVAAKRSILVTAVGGGNCAVGADVHAPIVRLTGTVVYGNVYAERVVLEHSVVLGIVHADEEFTADSCYVGSYWTGRTILEGPVRLGLPVAGSMQAVELNHPLTCIAFTDLAQLFERDGDVVKEYAFRPEDQQLLTKAGEQGEEPFHYLSLAPRLLDLTDHEELLARNRRLLKRIMLRDLIHPTEAGASKVDEARLERALLDMCVKPPTGDIEWRSRILGAAAG